MNYHPHWKQDFDLRQVIGETRLKHLPFLRASAQKGHNQTVKEVALMGRKEPRGKEVRRKEQRGQVRDSRLHPR